MAIVINTSPTNNASVNDEMLFVVYEATKANDDTTYPGYKYVCDIYVDDVFVSRIKTRPDPTYKRGIFNVAPVLRSYASYGLKANYASATETYTAKVNYKVKFGEDYNDTLYTNLTVDSSDRYAFKSYAVRPFTSADVVNNVDNDFATNCPDTVYSYKSLKWHLLPFIDDSSGISNFSYKFYDSSGSQVGSTGTISSSGFVGRTILQLNVGFVKLAATSSLSQSQQDSVDYVEISGNGETIRIKYLCTKYTPIVLAWLNQYGAYDSMGFGLVSKKTSEVQRKDFSKLDYNIDSSGNTSYHANGVFYGSQRTYASEIKQSLKLTSHLLTDSEYTWLAELFASTDVYLYDSILDKFVPVSVQPTTYDHRTYLNSRLTPLELNVQFTSNYNAQFL